MIIYRSYTTNVFRIFDLSFFRLIKEKHKFYMNCDNEKASKIFDKIIKLFYLTVVQGNIRNDFIETGFCLIYVQFFVQLNFVNKNVFKFQFPISIKS